MKKKMKITLGILFLMVAAILVAERLIPQQEDWLLYKGDGSKETVVDLAIQEGDRVLYLRKIKLVLDHPTVGDVIRAVSSGGEGIDIQLNDNEEIERIEDYKTNQERQWKILIDNEEREERNVWLIPIENYQGITFYCEIPGTKTFARMSIPIQEKVLFC